MGGAGLGTEPGGQLALLRLLAAIGGADLALGRLYEGHVNALVLLFVFGTPAQKARAAEDTRAGRVFGVWSTGGREPLRLERQRVEQGVGARGLLEPAGFAPRLRDLRMYLRQPAPDERLRTCLLSETPSRNSLASLSLERAPPTQASCRTVPMQLPRAEPENVCVG